MNPSTAYDITRLVTRVLNVTPNGSTASISPSPGIFWRNQRQRG
ncbi:MAG: hypothetical protein WB663_05925 [Beijerinckiaceae bacterium]|jgi:hypothetical protein